MLKHLSAAAALLLLVQAGVGAQTLRFETSAGSFDMTLNPTNDPHLQPLVDNLVAYVGLGRYHFSAVHRAAEGGPGAADDFVMQMGSFLAYPPVPDLWASSLTSIEALNQVVTDATGPNGVADGIVDFTALSNTRGTVSLALSGNPNSGNSSFFVNMGDNNFLDPQGFVPFARVDDLHTVERILNLMQVDLHQQTGTAATNPTFTDVPLTPDGHLVVVNDVKVISAPQDFSFCGPIATALQLASRGAAAAAAQSEALTSSSSELSSAALMAADPPTLGASSSATVPEPMAVSLMAPATLAACSVARRRPTRLSVARAERPYVITAR